MQTSLQRPEGWKDEEGQKCCRRVVEEAGEGILEPLALDVQKRGTKMNAGFVIEGNIPKQPAILSLQQHGDGIVELVVKFSSDSATHCLGFFKDGKLDLCVVDSDVLDSMGIQYTLSGASGGRMLVEDR